MKGAIVNCLQDLVVSKFGKDKWEAAMKQAKFEDHSIFLAIQDVDDAKVLNLVGAVCSVLNISLTQAADAFGEHWMCSYAPKNYHPFFNGINTAKDFLLRMDAVHTITTKNVPNAHPPRFDYTWENSRTLVMKYNSHRDLIDFMVGLIKGVGKYFKENLDVTKESENSVRVVFP
jgi:Haem-NO-binding